MNSSSIADPTVGREIIEPFDSWLFRDASGFGSKMVHLP